MNIQTEIWVSQQMPCCTDVPQSVNVCQSTVWSDDVLKWFHTELRWQTGKWPSECCESASWISPCLDNFLSNFIRTPKKSKRDVYKFNNILFFFPHFESFTIENECFFLTICISTWSIALHNHFWPSFIHFFSLLKKLFSKGYTITQSTNGNWGKG